MGETGRWGPRGEGPGGHRMRTQAAGCRPRGGRMSKDPAVSTSMEGAERPRGDQGWHQARDLYFP